ncbi:carbohydrate ABC transporter permease [Paramicrobacterium agarici]|uniref:Carbohydrate ABC transporter membrane protein 1 (CUT1 family) n=1 Tax=Paramicrobacterium agarici TaxID=630514 RepID=A0A2A9DTR7_9MICO|nr:sugar ABC transporter permease [Microbacterium agarici]PFG29993.1 carbohydrate ABC transporter membrane protein 1 (CUT1 family) [Microbacterium agarici]TQO22996.1 carbohydrate ABC transporter membrane protein 1 (CUT1 family) [Microbacterium agarici]
MTTTALHSADRTFTRRHRAAKFKRRIAPYVFVAPFIAIFLAFSVYPLFFTARLSFTNWRGTGAAEWVGWGNYTYLLTSPGFWNSLANSGVLWLLIVPIQIVVSVIVAVLLNSAKLKLRGMYRVAFIVPFVTPLVAVAQIWVVLFDQHYGAINAVLGTVGIPEIGWLTTSAWAKPTLALLFLWKTTGFIIIILLSGLQSIDGSLYEAAELDGASRIRQLWSITVPLLRRTIMFAVVLQTLAVFQMFAEPFVVTQGGPYNSTTTAGYYLYNHITRADLGTGAANSFLLVILVMILSLFFVRLLRAKD